MDRVVRDEQDFILARDMFEKGQQREAIPIFQRMFDEDSIQKGLSAYVLGIAYDCAAGVEKDEAKAEAFYEIAERDDVALATHRLAYMYHRRGDYVRGLSRYRMVAASNPSAAFWAFVILHYNPELGEYPYEAEDFLALACRQGHLHGKTIMARRRISGSEGPYRILAGLAQMPYLFVRILRAYMKRDDLIIR